LRANQAEALKEAALAGFGVVMLPTWLVGEEIAQAVCDPYCRMAGRYWTSGCATFGESGIHALYLPDRRGSPKVGALSIS
jgi:DNA-binding transcriptional LysR family regulator